MAYRSAWTAGNGPGYTWTTCINGSELVSMPSGSAVFSTLAFANQTNQDQLFDIGIALTIGSATPAAGSFIGIYVSMLNIDGSTYGDGSYTLGTQKALTPPQGLVGTILFQYTNATTFLSGMVKQIPISPGTFVVGAYSGGAPTLSGTAGNCLVKIRSFNTNLNN